MDDLEQWKAEIIAKIELLTDDECADVIKSLQAKGFFDALSRNKTPPPP